MPYGYFQFVRFTGFIGFAILAHLANKRGNRIEMILYGSMALLIQPFLKVAFGRQIWNIIDIALGLGLLVSIFLKQKTEKK